LKKNLRNNMKTKKIDYIFGVGRRKGATARVRLYRGKAENTVNGMPAAQYFPGEVAGKAMAKPFGATETSDKYYFSAKVAGGGKEGQLNALSLGLSRTLVKVSPDKNKLVLKKLDLLTRDSRIRQRRMVGKGGKSRRAKQSPKR
jgi:small subunit ribosomal protein S9